jgi:hypothetical protein
MEDLMEYTRRLWDVDIDRIIELLEEQRDATRSGSRSGYGQDKDTEIADIDELINTLKY